LLDRQGGALDLQAASGSRRVGLTPANQPAAGEDEVDIADRHHVALVQRRRVDANAVDERAVECAGIPDFHAAVCWHKHRVMP
jgi:hypothetical protein